jgi:predicted nucleic acid-binding protein
MVLCHTNVFIHAFNGRQTTIDRLKNIGLDQIVLSIITLMELYQGMGNKTEMAQMKRKIKYYDTVEIDTETSKLGAALVEKFKLSHNLNIPDALIGATEVIHRVPLYTYNTKDFDFIPGINLIV